MYDEFILRKEYGRTRHYTISVSVFLVEIREDLWVRARVVAEPVVVVHSNVPEHLHFVPHFLRRRDGVCHGSLRECLEWNGIDSLVLVVIAGVETNTKNNARPTH